MPEGIAIRPYEARDREAVRGICCETGYLGDAIDPVFEDRELFADYLTSYYTDQEPESSLVVEKDGVVKGYLLGSRFPAKQSRYNFWLAWELTAKGLLRYASYSRPTRAYVRWILCEARKEVPEQPKAMAHFHFNQMREVQNFATTRALINVYFDYLRTAGEPAVFGQVVTFADRRGARVFERFGFEAVEKREITKYRATHPDPVYLTTIVKRLR